jgi:hypothetical protein
MNRDDEDDGVTGSGESPSSGTGTKSIPVDMRTLDIIREVPRRT